ncbi:C40 family peptidase [Clostridium botulinum]|uniref:C40 family peptidase n=1 Tax=Clostridium botulinum TaxID=1491 RepID=UPI00174B2207|nr:C40 family peptidase [Clostridium botulinum]MBD5589166.1 C40 family peptidase [Clostridium botulinum]
MKLEIATQFYIKEIRCNSNYKTQNLKSNCPLIIDDTVDGFEFVVGLTTGSGELKITREGFKKSLIEKAKEMLGEPYKWGGDNPELGFDNSGLIYYVYKNSTGLDVGRTIQEQIDKGIPVKWKELQIGDVIFFGDIEEPHHVGIYVGNKKYIHSPKRGDVVKISKLSDRSNYDYACARRYF